MAGTNTRDTAFHKRGSRWQGTIKHDSLHPIGLLLPQQPPLRDNFRAIMPRFKMSNIRRQTPNAFLHPLYQADRPPQSLGPKDAYLNTILAAFVNPNLSSPSPDPRRPVPSGESSGFFAPFSASELCVVRLLPTPPARRVGAHRCIDLSRRHREDPIPGALGFHDAFPRRRFHGFRVLSRSGLPFPPTRQRHENWPLSLRLCPCLHRRCVLGIRGIRLRRFSPHPHPAGPPGNDVRSYCRCHWRCRLPVPALDHPRFVRSHFSLLRCSRKASYLHLANSPFLFSPLSSFPTF